MFNIVTRVFYRVADPMFFPSAVSIGDTPTDPASAWFQDMMLGNKKRELSSRCDPAEVVRMVVMACSSWQMNRGWRKRISGVGTAAQNSIEAAFVRGRFGLWRVMWSAQEHT